MRGADLVARALAEAGVKTIFSLSGNQIMPVYDACLDAGIKIHHTRHEGAPGYMADAWAQVTGDIGIAMITAAPGFANGLSPLYSALMAESPMVLLSGDSPRGQDNLGAFQELDQVAMSAPVCKLSFRAEKAETMGQDIARAIRVAKSGRPGPVHMAMPFDLLNEEVVGASAPAVATFEAETRAPDAQLLADTLNELEAAERPVVICGPTLNASRAHRVIDGGLAALADALDAPVLPMESPRGLKDPALGDVAEVMAEADLIISLGKMLDFTTGFAKPPAMPADCRFIAIDPDKAQLKRAKRAIGARLAAAGMADAVAAATALMATPQPARRAAWRDKVTAAANARAEPPAAATPMHPAYLCAAVQRLLDQAEDPILVVDGGEFGQWAQACISAPTRVINGASGAIGGGTCYAIAAKMARSGATVVALMGDGTAGFHFAEFETAHRIGAPIIAVIGNDARWNAEYQIQLRDYGPQRLHACELNMTDYGAAAAGFGCFGAHVADPAALDATLAQALEATRSDNKPACLSVEIEGLPAPSGSGH